MAKGMISSAASPAVEAAAMRIFHRCNLFVFLGVLVMLGVGLGTFFVGKLEWLAQWHTVHGSCRRVVPSVVRALCGETHGRPSSAAMLRARHCTACAIRLATPAAIATGPSHRLACMSLCGQAGTSSPGLWQA